MKKNLDTQLMMNQLTSATSYEAFHEEHKTSMGVDPFTIALRKRMGEQPLSPSEIIKAAQIDQSYGYQLINGTRPPSRDKVIQFGFALHLGLPEVNHLLQAAGKQPLYVKVPRDSILIYALVNRMALDAVNELLFEKGHETF